MNVPVSNQRDALRPPAYRRQRLLLFLLEQAGGRLGKRDFQKLLFLYLRDTKTEHYAFVPYKYGGYSFLAADDVDLLAKRGWVETAEKEIRLLQDFGHAAWAAESDERKRVAQWLKKTPARGNALVREAYRRYPYYAIRSEMKDRLLNEAERERVREANPALPDAVDEALFTIGYEGRPFEAYVNHLIQNDVRLLCDVRRNPLSRKFGFSKSRLSSLLPKLGIEYRHLPDLGIASEHRRNLDEDGAREALFRDYARELPKQAKALEDLRTLLGTHKRVALTCFEFEAHDCHRHCIADHLVQEHGASVKHL